MRVEEGGEGLLKKMRARFVKLKIEARSLALESIHFEIKPQKFKAEA
jgi:hypothetical protein